MKLLFCTNCKDVFNLKKDKKKSCSCGQASGEYVDRVNAKVSGGIALGFLNNEFIEALRNRPVDGMGEEFTAFVIPHKCKTITKE